VGVPPPTGYLHHRVASIVRPVDVPGVDAMPMGLFCPEANAMGVPPPMGTFINEPSGTVVPQFVQ